jgi:hypothetical protein
MGNMMMMMMMSSTKQQTNCKDPLHKLQPLQQTSNADPAGAGIAGGCVAHVTATPVLVPSHGLSRHASRCNPTSLFVHQVVDWCALVHQYCNAVGAALSRHTQHIK